MINTFDGNSFKRTAGKKGDRAPASGFQRTRVVYTATGGETSINLASTTPAITYKPGNNQLAIYRNGYKLANGIDVFETSPSTLGFAASEALIAGEIIEIMVEFALTGVMAASIRPDYFYQSAAAGQTLVTASFSWPYNLLPSIGGGGARVFLNGVLQTPGVDYTEVNLGNANTNQFSFVDALVGGENIQVYPGYDPIDTSAAASNFQGQQLQQLQNFVTAGTQAFIDQSATIAVPNTTIVKRASIPDITNDLRSSFGVDRIATQALYEIQSEAGPNGERVWGTINDDRGLVRFVGSTWASFNNNYGQFVSGATNEYVEITFYGTGLNLLCWNSAMDLRVTLDGGAEGSNIQPTALSGVLGARNYTSNTVVPAVSGLSLGIHTVKIRNAHASLNLNMFGFEICNASSTTLLKANPGSAYINGQKYQSLLQQSLAYNSGVTGTRGGRQLIYLTATGAIGNAFQAVNAAQANLASADHTNEEVARVYNWREFGAGRSDDFSTLTTSASARVFTMDDGTTTLAGPSPQVSSVTGEIQQSATNDFLTFTFIGSGLDFTQIDNGATIDSYTYFIDGSSVGTSTAVGAAGRARITKIASGLPYGTHTFKAVRTTNAISGMCFRNFIVYQPKKPALPAGAIELADYNVMANHVPNTTISTTTMGQGVIRKSCMRELSYVGSTWSSAVNTSGTATFDSPSGYTISDISPSANDAIQYTFFGTGVEMRWNGEGALSSSIQITLNGQNATTTNFPTMGSGFYGGGSITFSASTGILNQNSATDKAGCGMYISNLPLNLYTIKFTTTTAARMKIDALDFATPIHSYKSNPSRLQNTFAIGSQGMLDTRKTSAIKEIEDSAPNWSVASSLGSYTIGNTAGVFVPVTDMFVTMSTDGNPLVIDFDTYLQSSTSTSMGIFFRAYVDGVPVSSAAFSDLGISPDSLSHEAAGSFRRIFPVAAGVHSVQIFAATFNGSCVMQARTLSVQEMK